MMDYERFGLDKAWTHIDDEQGLVYKDTWNRFGKPHSELVSLCREFLNMGLEFNLLTVGIHKDKIAFLLTCKNPLLRRLAKKGAELGKDIHPYEDYKTLETLFVHPRSRKLVKKAVEK
jgi:hypothetical protein